MPQTNHAKPLDLAAMAWDIASAPYSVAKWDTIDAMDRIRECGPDVATEEDEGGGAHVVHDLAAYRDGARGDTGVVRGVRVLELVTFTDPLATIGQIADLAREMEKLGARPCIKFERDDAGQIVGATICRELVA